jgi:hypothetical protein
MAVIGSAAFGCVVGWAACFAAGSRPSVWLVRLLWIAVLALFVLAGSSDHVITLIAAAAFGMSGHLSFVLFIHNSRPAGRRAPGVSL